MSRTLPTLAFTATVFMMSCAANPNAPSPVKRDDPDAAGMRFRVPDALLVQHAVTQCQADARGAGLHPHSL